jgi:hypothetical protein
MAPRPPIRLPRQWARHVKLGILHAISLASVVVTVARGRAIGRRRLQARLEQAESEIALLREELLIDDTASDASNGPEIVAVATVAICWIGTGNDHVAGCFESVIREQPAPFL